ncbi:MAG: glycine--tRNA ligase, partial [Melioribacter sp.]|nr:glycine--tRNA ligase [Melioribacter sp.]
MDEVGTPFCITVDTQTLQDETVTIRNRDSMEQVRISINGLLNFLLEKLR